MAKFKKGDAVRQVMPAPIVGVVERYDVDQETGDVQILVTSPDVDGDGNAESRYFKEDQLEAVDG